MWYGQTARHEGMREAVEILFQSYLTSAPERGELLASRSDPFTTKKKPQVLIGKEAGWAPESIQTFWRRDKTLTSAWNQTTFPRLSSQSLHTVATALFRNTEAKKNYKTRINSSIIHLFSWRRLTSNLLNDSIETEYETTDICNSKLLRPWASSMLFVNLQTFTSRRHYLELRPYGIAVWKNGEWWNGWTVALSQNSWKGMRITRKIAFQTDGAPFKIWNEHLQNKVYTYQPVRVLDTVGYKCSCTNTHTVMNIT